MRVSVPVCLCVCVSRETVQIIAICVACLNHGRGEYSDNPLRHPARVCDDAATQHNPYARGRSKQEKAAGSQHYDVDFGGQPNQNAGYDHMHPDVDKYGNMAASEGFYDQDHPDADKYGSMAPAVNEGFYDQSHPDADKYGSLATVTNEGFYDQSHPDADK